MILLGLQKLLSWHRGPDGAPASVSDGWWRWTDQGHYIRAATALGQLDLSPASQWYEPGYPLLAAVFTRFELADPFLIPDALCYCLCAVLVGTLAQPVLAIGRGGAVLACEVLPAQDRRQAD